MPAKIARVLISVLVLPLAGLIYCGGVVLAQAWPTNLVWFNFAVAGAFATALLRVSWFLIWRAYVPRTRWRHVIGFCITLGTAVVAFLIMVGLNAAARDSPWFNAVLGTTIAPLLGQIAIMHIYQETTKERAERLHGKAKAIVVCPACGYNLAGLTFAQCPECGRKYTLDALIAAQPGMQPVQK